MDIYQLFRQDQLLIKKLIDELENTKDLAKAKALLDEIHHTTFLYTKSEEEVLYNPLREKLGKLEVLVEAIGHEHKLLLSSIEIIQELNPFQPEWYRIIKFVKSLLEQHTGKIDDNVFEIIKLYHTEFEVTEMLTNAHQVRKSLAGEKINN